MHYSLKRRLHACNKTPQKNSDLVTAGEVSAVIAVVTVMGIVSSFLFALVDQHFYEGMVELSAIAKSWKVVFAYLYCKPHIIINCGGTILPEDVKVYNKT